MTGKLEKGEGVELLPIARVLEPLLARAEKSFATTPKALWSTQTYLAPKDVIAIREALTRSSLPNRGVGEDSSSAARRTAPSGRQSIPTDEGH